MANERASKSDDRSDLQSSEVRWATIERLPHYRIGSHGLVVNADGDEIAAHPVAPRGRRQYRYIMLWSPEQSRRRHFVVARLVLEAFVGPAPSRRHVVCRINGRPTDDRLENLRWATMSEAQGHAIKMTHGDEAQAVLRRGKSSIAEETIRAICHCLATSSMSYREIAERHKVSKSTVTQIANGKRWREIGLEEGLRF